MKPKKTPKSLNDLNAAPYNPRTISPEAAKALATSMARFGDLSGLVFNTRTRHMIAGHQRRSQLPQNAKIIRTGDTTDSVGTIGYGHIDAHGTRWPLRFVDWPEAKEKVANVAANSPLLAGVFTHDLGALLEQIKSDDEALFKSLRFDDLEIPEIIIEPMPGDNDPDAVPEPPKKPVSKTGDLWHLGKHRLLCGDCTRVDDVERLMAGEKASILVTSPPYNQCIDKFRPSGMHKEDGWVTKVGRLAYPDSLPEEEYQAQQRAGLAIWFDAMCDGASAFYNHKNRYRQKQVVSPLQWLPGPFRLRQEIVWRRPGSITQNARMFLPSDERIYWMYRGNDFTFNDTTEIKSFSTVWSISNETNNAHAVGFPVELPLRCIKACSGSGATLLDPYLGSGTTLIACEQLGRRCYAMEIEPRYVDVAVRRWEEFTGKKAKTEKGKKLP